jgi:periplasmic mercuric ion binding protein
MKSVKLLVVVMVAFAGSVFAQSSKTETIKVLGNCGTCKKHIEKAALTDGVSKAVWDTKTKILTVSYDPAKISNDAIQKNVAAVGYDTEKYKGDDKAYDKLDDCCQYERKKN